MNTRRVNADAFRALPGPRGLKRQRHALKFFGTPVEALTSLHATHGDVAAIEIFGDRLVSLRDPAHIDQLLRDPDGIFIKDRILRDLATLLGTGLLTSENPLWMQQRRLIAPAFQRKRVLVYAHTMRRLAREMMAGWTDGQRVNLHDEWMRVTLRIVAETLFDAEVHGLEHEVSHALELAMKHFDRELNTPMAAVPTWVPTPTRAGYRTAVKTLDRVVYRLIEERRKRGPGGEDLLGRMMFAEDDDGARMSDKQLRDEVITLFLAGHETTALTMTWTALLLSRHPSVEARLHGEIVHEMPDPDDDEAVGIGLPARLPYTLAVLRESMRVYPPAWIVGREATADVAFGENVVPAGSQVMACTYMMHHDARFFDAPESFRPSRWLDGLHERLPRGAYFPFGGGPRICIGNHFAMMEAAILLTEFARTWRFHVDADYVPELVPAITMRPRHGLPGVLRRV
jgi:cytochrome P450